VLQLNKEDKSSRKFILVELDDSIARTVTVPRVKKVIEGYDGQVGTGGSYDFIRLDRELFDENGQIGSHVRFLDLARHVFFSETGTALGPHDSKSPFLGACDAVGYFLLFNGVLGDKTPDGGNILTGKVLSELSSHEGPRVIFGEGCRLSAARLQREQITFKQIPYQLRRV
jgi:hypothetical protein